MEPLFQARTFNRIVMKSIPLFEGILGLFMVIGIIPVQHPLVVVNTDTLAVCLDDSAWIVKQIICIDHANVDFAADIVANYPIRAIAVAVYSIHAVAVRLVSTSDSRANLANRAQVVEDAAQLVIASLARHKIVEPGNLVKRGNGAAIVAGNTGARVANQESKVKFLKNSLGDYGRVTGFR